MKEKKRIVVKIGSSSLQHVQTGDLDYVKLEKLVRILSDLRNQGKEVVLVTSGAIASGKQALNDPDGSNKAGLCRRWTGKTYDDLSEAFYGV